MWQDPGQADADDRLLPRALRFLACYGFYVTASTDRTVGRILDFLAQLKQVTPCPMVGPYKPALAHESALFSRVSYTANSLRYAVRSLREGGVLPERWSDPAVWRLVLGPSDLYAASCAQAALSATQQTAADWRVESSLAGGQVQGIRAPAPGRCSHRRLG